MNNNKWEACVVGIGSPQGNDSAGWRVVENLQSRLPRSVCVVAASEPTRLLPLLGDYQRVWIVDACHSKQRSGIITRFVWPDDRIDRRWTLSGHGIGLAEVLKLAETLGTIPRETIVYTIDVGCEPNQPGGPMAAEVAGAVRVLRQRLLDEIVSDAGRRTH